jgi:hypothetical protein
VLTAGCSLLTTYRCVDYAVKIRVNAQQTGIDTNVKHSMVRQPAVLSRGAMFIIYFHQ